MADLRMKDEEIDEPSLFVDSSQPPVSFGGRNQPAPKLKFSVSTTKKSQQPLGIEIKWKQPFEKILQRCLVKEKAAESGLQCLKHLKDTLKAHDDSSLRMICQLWVDRIDTILADKEALLIYMGFIGGTGAGKTTLINALLQMKGLLPTSSIKACTAVVVEVSYNHSDEKDALFRAQVEFVGRDDWRKELEVLFADLKGHYSKTDGGDGEQDEPRLDRITDALATLQVVYPHLKSINDLRATSVEDLMKDKMVRPILGSRKNIQSGRQSSFTKAIKPYIATSDSDKAKLDYWPLIQCVRVFVKVEFLKSGIVLVDLPGNMDRNSTRGAVAMKYLKKLAVPLIVANAVRGIDDRNAHEILEDVMKTDLKMDGIYNAGKLCFILSQFDIPYDVSGYCTQNDHLHYSLREDFAKARELKATLAQRKTKLTATQETREGLRRSIEDTEAQIEQLKSQNNRSSKSSARPQLKRKRGAVHDTPASKPPPTPTLALLRKKLSTLTENAMKEADLGDSLNKSILSLNKALQFNTSRIYQACNDDRKAKAIAAVKKDFENNLRDMGKTGSDNTLQVFCTASMVSLDYLTIQGGRMKQMGFPDQQSTEIPKLRDWLVEFTLPGRESKAQVVLEDIERLMTSMKPWVDDRSGDVKFSASERAQREPGFEHSVKELAEKFSHLGNDTTETLKQMSKMGVFDKMSEVERSAAKKSTELVASWAKLKWNTHRALNQRNGEWEEKGGSIYMWNDNLAQLYKDQIYMAWDRIFYEVFPQEILSFAREQKRLIIEFSFNTANSDLFLGHAMAVELLREQLLKTGSLASTKCEKISAAIDLELRNSHRLTSLAIRKFLVPMYAHCAAQGGTGHFKRNKDFQQKYMKENAIRMYQEVSQIIRKSLCELLTDLPRTFAKSSAEISTQIRQEIAIFFEQNSSMGARTGQRRVLSQAKIKLQNALDVSVGHLIQAWNENVEFKAEEPYDMKSLDFQNDGRFNIEEILENEDDGDYNDDVD